VRELAHEFANPTIDGQIVDLKTSGADVVCQFTTSPFVAQGIRKVAELG